MDSDRHEDFPAFPVKGKTMKAFVMEEIGRVGFLDKPVPRPGPNDVIVKTTRALICTSDSHMV
jgi:threonine dehydrogenase-like Zn-dependent dehydrogenase